MIATLVAVLSPATAGAAETWKTELVSPQRSGGQNVAAAWGSANGENAFFYKGFVTADVFLADRTTGGWESQARFQQHPDVQPTFQDGTADLSRVILSDFAPGRSGDTVYKEGIYAHEQGGVDVIAAWDDYSGRPGNQFEKPVVYLGGSSDKRMLFLYAEDGELDAPATATALYRWRNGSIEPIVIEDQRFTDCSNKAMIGGMVLNGQDVVDRRVVSLGQNGISADGGTFLVAPRSCNAGGIQYPTHLYLFRDGAAPIDITRPVAGTDAASTFVGMTPDGSRIFLTSNARLTADDADTNSDVYMWEGGSLTRLTADPVLDGLVPTATMVSPDGSTVWIQTRTAASPFSYELFTWRDGEVKSVATPNASLGFSGNSDENPTQLARDGSALVISANPSVFGTPGSGTQLYRITMEGEVTCVSCNGEGEAVAPAVLSSEEPMYRRTAWPDPRISADGSTIAFETVAPLVPEDTNGKVDVYVWRNGAHELISSGTIGEDAVAVGLSWDGRTAFFKSWGAILPGSSDPYLKLYAARIGGGFSAPPAPGACGADCQGPVRPVPSPLDFGSANFVGGGNISAPAERPRAAIRVARLRPVRGTVGRLRVRVPGAGRLALAGPTLQRVNRHIPRAGSYTVRVALRPQLRKRLARKQRLRVRARVVYRAGGGSSASRRVLITFVESKASRRAQRSGR